MDHLLYLFEIYGYVNILIVCVSVPFLLLLQCRVWMQQQCLLSRLPCEYSRRVLRAGQKYVLL